MRTRWVVPVCLLLLTAPLAAQQRFSIDDVLSPGYPFELVSARGVDRLAWIEYERGVRNVYTAAGPDFRPVKLTDHPDDDGNDLTNLRISDDGTTLVYVRGHMPNRRGWVANPASHPDGVDRTIWAVSTEGGEPRAVVEVGDPVLAAAGRWVIDAGNPVLSPDGRWVLYEKDGQIYREPTSGGSGRGGDPLFTVYMGARDPVWSPDSRKIAFVSDRDSHSFVGTYDVGARTITWLAPGVDWDDAPAWSPDGNRVVFTRRPGLAFGGSRRDPFARRTNEPEDPRAGLVESRFAGGYDFSIWTADAESGQGREIWHNEAGDSAFSSVQIRLWTEEKAGDSAFSSVQSLICADQHILFMAEPGNWRHYFAVPASGSQGPPTELTPGEGIAEHVGVSVDGRTLYYSTNVGDIHRRHIWKVATSGGDPVPLTSGDGIETYPVALASGNRVAALVADAKLPQSVGLISSGGGAPRVIAPTLPPQFPLDEQVVPENVTLTAADGMEFWNQLWLPKDLKPGERRPAAIFIHGGSRRQMLLGYHYMHFYHMAYAMNQYFANKGYVVLSINYRSGVGYGKEFRETPEVGGRGNAEYRDIVAAGEYLQSRPDVDADRIGLWGLSYGGVLTAQGLARNSDIFAAGVDIAGVHLWSDTIDPDSVSYQSSAIAAIDGWTSPVLLVHGDDDRNVDFAQTVGLVQLLRAHDVYHELIVFPDDVHDFLIYDRFLKTFEATDDFFDRFLINKARATEPEGGSPTNWD